LCKTSIKQKRVNRKASTRSVFKLGKVEEQIVEVLQKSGKPLALVEIAEQLGKPPKKVFGPLRRLFEDGKVDCDLQNRTYRLAKI